MPEALGSAIGPYRIVAPIGSGGFSTVYQARDDRLDSEVAIKVLAENHSLDPDIRARFLAESRLLRRVASDHVIRVLDIGETERLQPFLVMEHATGGDLRHRVAKVRAAGARPTPVDLEVVARALGSALGALHAGEIVHRDVSPGNLLLVVRTDGGGRAGNVVGAEERVVLADLGYAKDLGAHSGMTVGGGTHGYRAPEQRNGVGRVDERADIYSASAVVAWLATGEDPEQVATDRPAGRLRAAGVGAPLARVLGQGLARDPRDRHGTVAEWVDAVCDAVRPVESPPGDAPSTTRTPVSPPPTGRRRRAVPAALFALLAATAVVVVAVVVLADGGGGGPSVTDLGDGRVRVARSDDGVRVAIFGPARLVVGEVGRFEAGVDGGRAFAWVMPDGRIVADAGEVDLVADQEGAATLTLLVTTVEGGRVEVDHTLEVIGG